MTVCFYERSDKKVFFFAFHEILNFKFNIKTEKNKYEYKNIHAPNINGWRGEEEAGQQVSKRAIAENKETKQPKKKTR